MLDSMNGLCDLTDSAVECRTGEQLGCGESCAGYMHDRDTYSCNGPYLYIECQHGEHDLAIDVYAPRRLE